MGIDKKRILVYTHLQKYEIIEFDFWIAVFFRVFI